MSSFDQNNINGRALDNYNFMTHIISARMHNIYYKRDHAFVNVITINDLFFHKEC